MTEQPDILSAWLYQLLTRRWPIVAILTVAGVAAGAVVALARAPTYSSTALLRVGTVVDRGNLEPPRVVATRLETLVAASAGNDRCAAQTSFVNPPESLVSLTVRCPDPDRPNALAEEAVNATLKRHAELFDKALNQTRDYVESLKNTLARLAEATTNPKGNTGDSEAIAAWLLRVLSMDLRRVAVLEPGAYTFRTEVLQPASEPVASTPRRSAIAIGGLCGLILGLLVAVLLQVAKAGNAHG